MNTSIQSNNSFEARVAKARVLGSILTAMLAVLTILIIVLTAINKNGSTYFLTGTFIAATLISLLGLFLISRRKLMLGVSLIAGGSQLSLIVPSLLAPSIGIPLAISILLITTAIALVSLEEWQITYLIISAVVTGFLALLASLYTIPFVSFQRLTIPGLEIGAYGFMGLQLLIFLVLIFRRYIRVTLQIKMLGALLPVTLIPLAVIAISSINTSTNVVKDQANQSLLVAGNETANVIDQFFQTNLSAIRSEAIFPSIVTYMILPEDQRNVGTVQFTAQNTLQSLISKDPFNILSYALVDKNGMDIMDTDLTEQDLDESDQEYFKYVTQNINAHISPLQFLSTAISTTGIANGSPVPMTTIPIITFSAPILNGQGELLGIIRIRYKADVFLNTLKNNQNLVKEGSYPILLDENQFRLADPVHTDAVDKFLVLPSQDKLKVLQDNFQLPAISSKELSSDQPALSQILSSAKDRSFFTTESLTSGVKEIGVLITLKSKPWHILYMQKEATILVPVTQQTQTVLTLVYLISALAGLLSIWIANLLSHPISILTSTAQRIASGDLQAQANVRTGDEIEILAHTFNLMTTQLRTFISGLEERVQQRTQELARQTQRAIYRAAQIQTLSDVARAITSVQDLEELLLSVSRLTSERFNFYHVGIFLVDPTGEYAVLRATNSEGGARMLSRQHRLKIGQVGIVGNVASTGKPRLATDVGQDASYFNNPDLPLTRSEMALPLITSGKVIGVLDVQSTITNAFTEDDINLFSTLADQVAIAIVNNRLFTETRLALSEAQEVHRKYLRQAWETEISEQRMHGYQYDMHGLTSIGWQNTPEIDIAVKKGETVTVSHSGTAFEGNNNLMRSALAVPIKLRGEVIGVIDLQDADTSREWFQEEIDVVQAVADQVAVALENARLFEQTVRRAERERKVFEITDRIRSSNDPQVMIKTAVSELQLALKASRAQILLQPNPPVMNPAAPENHNNGHKNE